MKSKKPGSMATSAQINEFIIGSLLPLWSLNLYTFLPYYLRSTNQGHRTALPLRTKLQERFLNLQKRNTAIKISSAYFYCIKLLNIPSMNNPSDEYAIPADLQDHTPDTELEPPTSWPSQDERDNDEAVAAVIAQTVKNHIAQKAADTCHAQGDPVRRHQASSPEPRAPCSRAEDDTLCYHHPLHGVDYCKCTFCHIQRGSPTRDGH